MKGVDMTSEKGVPQREIIVVHVDEELEELIPGFLANRHKDLKVMLTALDEGDYETIQTLGHTMKGAGGGYGFDAITDIGDSLEKAAMDKHPEMIKKHIDGLSHYLEHIEVVYE